MYNTLMQSNHLTASALFLVSVMVITSGCSTTPTDLTSQFTPSTTHALVEDSSKSYTEKVTSTVGGYYDETVSFLSDECGVAGYSLATGKAVLYGIGGGVWGASEGSLWGAATGDSVEGMVIGSIVGSAVGLAVGVKKAYDGFESDTAGCGKG